MTVAPKIRAFTPGPSGGSLANPGQCCQGRDSPAAVGMRRWGPGLRLEAWVPGEESRQVCRAVQVVRLVDIFSKKKEARLSHQGKQLITCVSRDTFCIFNPKFES